MSREPLAEWMQDAAYTIQNTYKAGNGGLDELNGVAEIIRAEYEKARKERKAARAEKRKAAKK